MSLAARRTLSHARIHSAAHRLLLLSAAVFSLLSGSALMAQDQQLAKALAIRPNQKEVD